MPPVEFIALTDKYLAGELSADELRRWEELCAADPASLAYYISLAKTEGLIPEVLAGMEESRVVDARHFFLRRHLKTLTTIAAVLAFIAAGSLVWHFSRFGGRAGVIPATITSAVGVRWTEGGGSPGARLPRADGAFASGLLELTFDSGARLLVQGPASYAVTGPNSVRLMRGKAVADVPRNARGFTVEGPRDRIVDHGTRFAVDMGDGAGTTLGVLSGEVELFYGKHNVRLFTDYAVQHVGDSVTSVPFLKENFVTETPAREFPWSLDGTRHDVLHTLTFDVSRLVYGPGDYRAVVRWLLGNDAITVRAFRLKCGDVLVASAGSGRSGVIENTFGNAPVLRVTAEQFRPQKWTLEIDALCEGAGVHPPRPVSSQGVVSFEEGLSINADASRFVGSWRYSHNGSDYLREFLPDGTARLYINGKRFSGVGLRAASYTVADGVLTVHFSDNLPVETHMLRDDNTLVFLNRPYRAAKREPNKSGETQKN